MWRSVFLLLAAFGLVLSSAAHAAEQPNVVFILADDLGREDCGFMGGKEIRTPQLDKLAASGAKLDACYVLPVCSPTRAALLTGRYPLRHGLQVGVVRPWAQYGLPLEERTLAEALQQAGYATAIVGKWHLGHFAPEYLPTRRGFDHQYGHYNGAIDYFDHTRDGGFDWHRDDQACRDEGYSTHLIAKDAAQFVAKSAGQKPFFLYVAFNAVHSPHQVPDEYTRPYQGLKGQRRKYAGMLSAMDEAVGQIVDAVDKAGVRKETLFIFSSDNGGPRPGVITDNGKYRGGKGTLYEGGVRVAAFVTWEDRVKAGGTIAEPLHAVDWYPTLLKLCGARLEQQLPLDGRDVWPTLTQGKPSPHSTILLNALPNGGALRAGDWKLLVQSGSEKESDKESVELFNLQEDPYEKVNLAEQNPEKVKELRLALAKFAEQAVPPRTKPKAKGFTVPKVWGEKT